LEPNDNCNVGLAFKLELELEPLLDLCKPKIVAETNRFFISELMRSSMPYKIFDQFNGLVNLRYFYCVHQ